MICNGSEEERTAALKLVDARINNLESNFHIEIDMERIEDKSKALSYIGIEIAEALKYIPAPVEEFVPEATVQEVKAKAEVAKPSKENIILATAEQANEKIKQTKAAKAMPNVATTEPVNNRVGQTVSIKPDIKQAVEEPLFDNSYMEQTRFDVKPSLWQRIKNSKVVRAISYIMKIKVVLEFPALPEGRGDNL